MTTADVYQPTRPEEFVEPGWARFLFASTTAAWIWLVIRLYMVTVYLPAGWSKMTSVLNQVLLANAMGTWLEVK